MDMLLKFGHYVAEQLYFGINMEVNLPPGEKRVHQFLS